MWGLSLILFWPSNRLATRLLTLTPSKHRSCTVSVSLFVLLLLFTLYCCCKGAREASWTRSIKLFVLLTSVKLQSLKSQRAILNTHIHTSTVICENISAETRRRGMQRQEEQGCLLCCAVCFWGFFLFVFFHSRAKRGAVKMRVSGEERRSRSADGDGERYRQPERMKNRCREGAHPLLFEQPRSWRKYKQTVVTDWVSQNMSQCWCYKIYCFVWPVHLDGKTYTLCIYIKKSLLVFK